MSSANFEEYKVWDASTRVFHWVNFICVVLLIFVGMVMLYKKELGIVSIDAKIALKTVHVIVGYIFSFNVLWRLVWGFIGSKYARWKNIFPGKGFIKQLGDYRVSIKSSSPQQYLGHNPLGRLAVSLMILLLITMMVTGLVRAGTDIYYPPLGSFVAEYIVDANTSPDDIVPYNSAGTVKSKVSELKSFKKPFGVIHLYSAYILMFIIIVHIYFVIRAERKEGGSLISAMFTGKKLFKQKPVDIED